MKATRRARLAAIIVAGSAWLLLPPAVRAAEAPGGAKPLKSAESAELRALRAAERELFPPATRPKDNAGDSSWLARLEMPDLPVRWDERVVRYLEFFRDDPRGHAGFASLFRHWGRFRELVRGLLREKSLPEDLVWVSMIESGFDPVARSASGAAGLWQFMPETGRVYGLAVDRWLDQRYSARLATVAATDVLGDLHRRFGSWELALAAYNMGYAGLASVVRRYNTNDFWSLARVEGALPWETTLYVPKILAASVVAHNLETFGFGGLALDSPIEADPIDVPSDTPLAIVAQAAGCNPTDVEALNPELRAGRAPPASEGDSHYPVKVPRGTGFTATQALGRLRKDPAATDGVSLLPGRAPIAGRAPLPFASKLSVIVPKDEFLYPERRRMFYRVLAGDTPQEIASALHVSMADLCRWNDLDPTARLQSGMTLQAFVPPDAEAPRIAVVAEDDVRVLSVGSEEFFSALEQDKRFTRIVVAAETGDTLESIGKRFDVPASTMERINRRGRSDALRAGERVVVYVPSSTSAPRVNIATTSSPRAAGGALPALPIPDLPQ